MTRSALVIIPCLNESNHLDRLLTQLSHDPTSSKIVIADGGSTDGSQAIVQRWSQIEPRVVLMHNPKMTQSCGINAAVLVHGENEDWVVRVDAHCLYPDNYVLGLLEAQARSGAQAIVVPMITQGHGGFQTSVAIAQNSKLGTGGSAHRTLGTSQYVDHGHHALMAKRAFVDAGGYCEAMICNEDAELDVRLTKLGHLIWLETSLPIIYYPRSSPQALWKQYFKYGQGRARNVLRHKLRMKVRQLLPVVAALSILSLPVAILNPILAAPALLWICACLVGGFFITDNSVKQQFLNVSLAAGIMHLAWGLGFLHELATHRNGVKPRFGFVPIHRS